MIFTQTKHPSETQLEQFAQFRDELDQDLVSAITSHLKACSACKEIVEWFRVFYSDLWKDENSHVTPPNVIPLVPYRITHRESLYTPIVLAAMSQKVQQRFVRLSTLYSEEEGVIARVLSDEQEHVLELYLHSKEPLEASAIVEFPQLGVEVVTDENGRATFQPPEGLDRGTWSDTTAVVHIPFSKTKVDLENLGNDSKKKVKAASNDDDLEVEFRLRSDQLMVHCIGNGSFVNSIRYMLISTPNRQPFLLAFDHGMGITTIVKHFEKYGEMLLFH